jgi:hypothetical protein
MIEVRVVTSRFNGLNYTDQATITPKWQMSLHLQRKLTISSKGCLFPLPAKADKALPYMLLFSEA